MSTNVVNKEGLKLKILSSDPSLVTGGDALVEVSMPDGVDSRAVKVLLNGNEVTDQLLPNGATRTLRGLIGGMHR